MAGCLGRQVASPPPPRAMGCNRNRPDINTTTVGGRGGGLGDCVYRLSLPRHGGPEGGGGVWEMDIRDPPWAQANFPPPQLRLLPCPLLPLTLYLSCSRPLSLFSSLCGTEAVGSVAEPLVAGLLTRFCPSKSLSNACLPVVSPLPPSGLPGPNTATFW